MLSQLIAQKLRRNNNHRKIWVGGSGGRKKEHLSCQKMKLFDFEQIIVSDLLNKAKHLFRGWNKNALLTKVIL